MNFLPLLKPEPPPFPGVVNGSAATHATPIYCAVEMISPELATKYLAFKNEGNRNLMETFVGQIIRDIEEGRWELTGQPIIFDSNGRLIDGHHRLTAISRGSSTVPVLDVRNAKPDAVRRIDTGNARRAGQIAQMDGHPQANNQTALVKWILIHERHGIDRMNNPRLAPTKAECVDELRLRPGLLTAVHKGIALWRLRWTSPALASFCYYVFAEQNKLLCDKFWDALCGDGAGLSKKSPVLLLRNRLADNASGKSRLPQMEIVALMFIAWKAFRDNKQLGALRWRTKGNAPEQFPQI
jgi:hypothetical protein